MNKALCPLLLLITIQVAGQRVASISVLPFASSGLAAQNSAVSSGKTLSIGGGEFKLKSMGRIGFDAVCVRTLDANLNQIQKNSMAVAGFNIQLFNVEGFSTKIYLSQGFNMRQAIVRYPSRENVTFEALVPVFSMGMGMEYKINKYVCMFSRLRWIGGDVTNLGSDQFQYGQFVLHTGISCKITAPKKWG